MCLQRAQAGGRWTRPPRTSTTSDRALARSAERTFEVEQRGGDGDRVARHRQVADPCCLRHRPAFVAGVRGALRVGLAAEQEIGAGASAPAAGRPAPLWPTSTTGAAVSSVAARTAYVTPLRARAPASPSSEGTTASRRRRTSSSATANQPCRRLHHPPTGGRPVLGRRPDDPNACGPGRQVPGAGDVDPAQHRRRPLSGHFGSCRVTRGEDLTVVQSIAGLVWRNDACGRRQEGAYSVSLQGAVTLSGATNIRPRPKAATSQRATS
jgi:hypothetical protein